MAQAVVDEGGRVAVMVFDLREAVQCIVAVAGRVDRGTVVLFDLHDVPVGVLCLDERMTVFINEGCRPIVMASFPDGSIRVDDLDDSAEGVVGVDDLRLAGIGLRICTDFSAAEIRQEALLDLSPRVIGDHAGDDVTD